MIEISQEMFDFPCIYVLRIVFFSVLVKNKCTKNRTFIEYYKKGVAVMASLYENIQNLCQQAGITGGKLCSELGFSRSTLSDLKAGRVVSLSSAKLQKIAEYFHVSVDTLLGTCTDQTLSPRDERDISRKLEETLQQLEGGQDGLMFDGEPIDDETRELLYISLKNSLEVSKRIAKKKYTPKKYRD